ncbi:hypothetical protein CSKR_106184 [Clonorchis sinensis]|uniref:Uncharacterized protein n=1 Tax=Clonorchis sinensis TaxID=79923 RepID=A0A8T1MD40_CLOSI|nr:hypothetical protein CSKR_106184 [Clonorchis sinensis]
MTKATQERKRMRRKHHRFNTSERAEIFRLHLLKRPNRPNIHTNHVKANGTHLSRYLNGTCLNQSNILPGNGKANLSITKTSNSSVDLEQNIARNGGRGGKPTHKFFESTESDLAMIKWLKKIKPRFMIAPDGFVPNSRIRSKIILKPVHLANLRQISAKISKCEEIDRILFSQLVEGDGDLATSYWNLTAQVNALIREELPVFMRNVYQEEKYRIEGLLSSDGERSEPPHQLPTPRLPVSLNFMHKRALMIPNNQVKPSEYQTRIESILSAPSDTRKLPPSSAKYMDQTQFEELLNQMISHVGSRSRVYELVRGALNRDPFAVNQIGEMLGSRTARTPFLETICSPTYLFDFLASLLGSRAAVRISLSEILGGSINKLDKLAAQIDSDTAIIEFAGAFQEAWREAIMLIQSYTPLSMSSSSILDMLIDGEESTEHIADLINGVDTWSQDCGISMKEMTMPFQIAPEILEQITTSVIACDVNRLKELKVTKFSAHQRYEEGTEKSISALDQLLLSERALATLKLKSLLAANSLVRDTLNEVIHSSQTSVFEPTANDYVTLVNKGDDFFIARSDTSRPADEQVIDHFSNLTRRLRHVMAWAFIKDPLRGDLHKENFEHVVRHALQVTETATKQVIEYIAGAAKSRNVPELIQQAVAGSSEASQELKSFLGPGKSDFVVRTIQETRGQVVDRILRHCATNSEPEEVSGVLQRIHEESNSETAKALIQSWIRLSLNISRLAVKLSVAKTAEKTRSLLHSAELLEAQSDFTTKANELSVPETALATRHSHIWPVRMSAVEEPSKVTVVKSTKKRLIVKTNTLVETGQSPDEALLITEYDNDVKDDHTPVHTREHGAQLFETDNLQQIRLLESSFSSSDREYEEFTQQTGIVCTAADAMEYPVVTFGGKSVETDVTSAAKKSTDDLTTQKTVKRQKASSPTHGSSLIPQPKRSSFILPPQSSSPGVASLLQLRKEYALIETRSKAMRLSRLELRSKIERLRDEGLLSTTFAELPEYKESDVKAGIQATKREVKVALAHIQNAIDNLTISVLIEQSKHQLPKKHTRFTRKLGFLRTGSTLLNETVSSIARRSKSADQIKALLAASGKLAQPSTGNLDLDEPSYDVHLSSSAESSSTSSGDRANRCSQIERLNELQTYCQTSAAQLLMGDQFTQETMLLDEQGMQLRKFNTFFVENVRKFIGEFTLAIREWGPDSEDDRDNRVTELKEMLIERMTEMTENFPEDVKEKLSAAVDILIEDIHERLRKITESVPTEDWTLDEQQHLPEELTNQLMKAVTSIFYYRVRPIISEWEGLQSAQLIQAERLNELRENSVSRLKDLVEVIRNELLGDNMTPPLVTAAIEDRLNQLRKEAQMAIKEKCKELLKQNKLLVRKTRRSSVRSRVSLMSDRFQFEDQIEDVQQPSTMEQESIITRSEQGNMDGEMIHTSVPPPTPATESVLVCSSRLDEDQLAKHLTPPNTFAPRKTGRSKQMFEALESVKTPQSPARTKVVHDQQMRSASITRPLTKPKPMTLSVREKPKSPLVTPPKDTNWDDVASTVPRQENSEAMQMEQPTRKLSEYVATDMVLEPIFSDESPFVAEEKTPTDNVPKPQPTVGSLKLSRTRDTPLGTRQTDVFRHEVETKTHFINQEMGIFVKGLERKRGTSVLTYDDGTLPNKSPISEVFPEGSSLVESVSSTRPSTSREMSNDSSSVPFQLEPPETILTKGQKLSCSSSVSEKLWERTSFRTDSASSFSDTSEISLSTRRSSEPVRVDKKPPRRKESYLPLIVSLPPRSRVVTRPSYIPCHEWSKMIGPRVRQTIRYDIDLTKESQLKRAEELHMSSSSLRRRYDMLDLFHRATLVEKYRNRLPPIQQHG